jgi:UDP:flavonoid glycosyltransferase YjiC (YdhE family)
MHQPKRILVCPLDWGLGHASRCIPVIHLLIQKGAEVIIAADGRPLDLLRQEFPQLTSIVFNGYNIGYPDEGSMVLKMISSIPKILAGIKKEHFQLEKFIHEHKIDIVISDNRYGCWNKRTKNIFITHQLLIKSPFGEGILHKIVLKHLKNYDECWIPDFEGEDNLSGDLSHKFPLPPDTFFIGPLSRFASGEIKAPHHSQSFEKYNLLIIISGPEPQRSNFEKIIFDQVKNTDLKVLIVCGKPESLTAEKKSNITIVSHLGSNEMYSAIQNSELVVSLSGYSTIMDLAVLGKKAVFVPTPGQTEQEYLGKRFRDKKIAWAVAQKDFNLIAALNESKNYSGWKTTAVAELLEKKIDAILFSK